MPLHDYLCRTCGSEVEISCRVAELSLTRFCRCGSVYERIYKTFPAAFVAIDICYDSPIDGRAITTKQARIEDLRRNGCRPYDHGEMEEVQRRKAKAEVELDRSIDDTVEKEVALMPQRKRELLEQEVRAGATTEIVRKDGTG